MKHSQDEPVNEWNTTTARLGFLTGGPLDSLLEQLAGSGASRPSAVLQTPVTAIATNAQLAAGSAPTGNFATARTR